MSEVFSIPRSAWDGNLITQSVVWWGGVAHTTFSHVQIALRDLTLTIQYLTAKAVMRSHNPYPPEIHFLLTLSAKCHYSDAFYTHPVSIIHITPNPTTHPSPTATPRQGTGPRLLLFRVVWAPGIPLRSVYHQFELLPILAIYRTSHFLSLYFIFV